MKLTDLTGKSTSDEHMQWVYDLIKEAYDNNHCKVVLKSNVLTLEQFTYLADVKGYTMEHNNVVGEDIISGW